MRETAGFHIEANANATEGNTEDQDVAQMNSTRWNIRLRNRKLNEAEERQVYDLESVPILFYTGLLCSCMF